MTRIACMLIAVSAALTGTLVSQTSPMLVAFEPLLTNPQPYSGQTIALHAVVEQSDAASRGLKLIEAKSPGAQVKDQVSPLLATWAKGATTVSLQNGQEAVVIGQVQIQDNAPILQIASIITDKDAIRRFTRPSERRPRPGDNLGHDAQPSKSLSD
ncbi:MAG: hypothetical protein JO170_13325 [Verrucomicrobia bacterium]|nr:hypothetical protein [Verrucomicrobiota bacterium]